MRREHLLHAASLLCLICVVLGTALAYGIYPADTLRAPYANKLFDASYVHHIDLQIADFESFVINADEQYVPCAVTIDEEVFAPVGIRVKGNNSRTLTQQYDLYRHSMKLEFDHYHDGLTYHGLDKFSLDASFQDNSYMKSFLAYDMMAHMGVTVPLVSYCFVTVNGQDWGLFLAIEEPEESFARRVWGDYHGLLYKPDYQNLNAENADVALRYIDRDPASYPAIFENAKFPATDKDQRRLIESLWVLNHADDPTAAVDTDACLRYFAVQVFLMNPDSYLGHTGHNYYLYEKDGILTILPWDYNLAFGTYCLGMTDPIRDPNQIINYPVFTPWRGDVMQNRPLFHNLMQDDSCFAQYRANLASFCSDYVQSGELSRTIRQTQEMIAPYVQRDPTAFCSYEDFLLACDTLEEFCLLRAQSVIGQLEGIYPATHRLQSERPHGVNATHLDIRHLGDFSDLQNAKPQQDAALAIVTNAA